jgi:hypothetical protein
MGNVVLIVAARGVRLKNLWALWMGIGTSRILPALLLLILGASHLTLAQEEPPQGCHWQPIPELKAHLAVPDGWLFKNVSSGEVLIYEVRPAGTGFEGVRALYRLEVRRNTRKSDVVARARDFVESARAAGVEAQPLEEQHVSVLTLYSSFVRFASKGDGAPALSAAVSSAGNSRTGTLYTARFDIPENEIEMVAPLGNHLFRKYRIDDEI